MSLPLSLRKDIRDNEAKLKDAEKALSTAVGFDITVVVENETIHKILAESNNAKKEAFTAIVADYLTHLSKQFATIMKDPVVKEDVTKALSAKKIIFTVKTDAEFAAIEKDAVAFKKIGGRPYFAIEFKDGACILFTPAKYFWSNIAAVGDPKELSIVNILSLAAPADALPLNVRAGLSKGEPEMQAAVKKVSAAVGFDVIFEFDPKPLYFALVETTKDYKDKIPDCVPRYITGLATNLEKICKDDMIKEGLLDKWKTKKLKVTFVKGEFPAADKAKYGGDSYIGLSFDGGDLAIVIPTKWFWSNIDNISKLNIEKLL
jgi:hypothetical protein